MQNLAGKNSIIGKSIVVTNTNTDATTGVITISVEGCCVIGQA